MRYQTEIVAKDFKAVTDLLWEIAFQFQIKSISFDCLHPSIHPTSKRNKQPHKRPQTAQEGVNALRRWCEEKTDQKIADFDESWRDGMNYARIVAKHRPALINFAALESMPLDKRLDAIFTIFEEKLDLFAHLSLPHNTLILHTHTHKYKHTNAIATGYRFSTTKTSAR